MGQSRGFGFVTYAEPTAVATVLKARPHTLDGKQIDPKPCTPASIQKQKKMNQQNFTKSHKIFLGGISMEATKDDIQNYFERYGIVTEVTFVADKNDPSRPHKGFGFVAFEDESSVEQAVAKHYHMIKDKRCEAKQAETNYKNKMQQRQQMGNNMNNMGMGNMNQMQMYNNQNQMGYNNMNNQMNQMMNNNMNNMNMMNNMGMNNQGYGNNNYNMNQMQNMSQMNNMNQMGMNNNMGNMGNNNNMMNTMMNSNNMNSMMNQSYGNQKSSYGSMKSNNRSSYGGNQGNSRNNPYNRR